MNSYHPIREEERRREEREERHLAAAERARTLASLNSLAATTESHFATRRNELVALREQQSDPKGWRLLTDAVAFLNGQVAAQVGQWRATMSAEIGATSEPELSRRLLALETQTGTILANGLRNLPAPTLAIAPPPTPAAGPRLLSASRPKPILHHQRPRKRPQQSRFTALYG